MCKKTVFVGPVLANFNDCNFSVANLKVTGLTILVMYFDLICKHKEKKKFYYYFFCTLATNISE